MTQAFRKMLNLAFTFLAMGVLMGPVLAVYHLNSESAASPPWWLAAIHAVFAVTGTGCLLLALSEPSRNPANGTGSFGMIAAALIVAAGLAGGIILVARTRKRRPAGALVAMHGMLAVSGFVILTVYVLLGR